MYLVCPRSGFCPSWGGVILALDSCGQSVVKACFQDKRVNRSNPWVVVPEWQGWALSSSGAGDAKKIVGCLVAQAPN